MAVVKYIVGEKNQKPLNIEGSVAIVGNSDLLVSEGFGAEIDSYDNIFRFNLANIDKQFHSAVGSKTDFFLMSQNITTYKFPHNKEQYMRFISHCRPASIICYPEHTKNVKKFNKKPLVMTLTPNSANTVFLKKLTLSPVKFSQKNHPRNGVKLLACLLDAGISPHLYGFDLGDRGDNKHYYDNEIQKEVPTGGHMPSWEYQLLVALREAGLIYIH